MSKQYIEYLEEKSRLIECRRLISIIDLTTLRKQDAAYVFSVVNKLKTDSEISELTIFRLRDIKDRQIEKG